MANKTIVANGNQFANKRMALHFATFPNHHVFLYFGKRTNKGIFTNFTSINIYRFNNGYFFSKVNILILA